MANQVTGRQLILDTAGQIPINANLNITDAEWMNATANDVLIITDAAGRVLTFKCYQTNYPTDLGKIGWLSGPVTITQIPSGILYLYLGK